MNKNKELIKNTFIIFVGKFCTQFISFLLVPIYTHYLLSEDFGYVDLVQTYISLLAPMVIVRFDSAIFRFLIDYRNDEKEKNKIISSSFYLILFQIFLLVILYSIANYFFKFQYWLGIILNIIFLSISNYLLQLTRGIGKNIDYSVACIISGIITISMNIVMIINLGYDSSSILYASSIANIFCSIYLIFKNNLYKYINIRYFNRNRLKEMLKYSLPMIPDGLSWWVVNASDRTIISFMINTAANGIYAVSSKFSNILSSIFQVFNMSWQESASLHINDNDKDEFFSNILNKSYVVFYSICILILATMPFIFYFFIGKEYIESYYYIPILLLGNMFNAFANVIGGIYIAKKETSKVAKTTIMAAFINIIINILLVSKFGLYAAAISTLISYIIVAFYRYVDVKKYIKLKVDTKIFIITIMLFIINSTLYYMNNVVLNIINLIIIIIIIIILNREYVNIFFNIIKKIRRVKL